MSYDGTFYAKCFCYYELIGTGNFAFLYYFIIAAQAFINK